MRALIADRSPGAEPADAGLLEENRSELGSALGRFLRVLHSPETLEAVDPKQALPTDFNRRADMTFRVTRARENRAHLEEAGLRGGRARWSTSSRRGLERTLIE